MRFNSSCLLALAADGWAELDWKAFFEERAGIAEFDGGLPRPEAEASALSQCIAEWRSRNSVSSYPQLLEAEAFAALTAMGIKAGATGQ